MASLSVGLLVRVACSTRLPKPDKMSATSRGACWPRVVAARLLWLLLSLGRTESALNCFSLVDESQWSLIINHNASQAAISLTVAGAGPEVITCLRREPEVVYRYIVQI